jgi:hypothetical protein
LGIQFLAATLLMAGALTGAVVSPAMTAAPADATPEVAMVQSYGGDQIQDQSATGDQDQLRTRDCDAVCDCTQDQLRTQDQLALGDQDQLRTRDCDAACDCTQDQLRTQDQLTLGDQDQLRTRDCDATCDCTQDQLRTRDRLG